MEFIQEAFDKFADRELLFGEINSTYREVEACLTKDFKLKSNRLALLAVSNGTSALLAYLACVLQDLPLLSLPEELPIERIEEYIDRYQPEYLIISADRASDISEAIYTKCEKKYVFDYCLAVFHLPQREHMEINDVIYLSTSGSTGDPKLVRLSEQNIRTNTEAICKSLELHHGDSTLLTLPLNYSFGLSVVNTHIFVGAKLGSISVTPVEKKFWDIFSSEKVTGIYGVPFQFEMFKRLKIFSQNLSDLRYLAQAGGALKGTIKEWYLSHCTEANKLFYVMYGQTECSPRISSFDLVKSPSKIDSVGIPLDCNRVHIEADAEGSSGEILVEGDNVFNGYALSRADMASVGESLSVHKTGDVGYIDNDGFLYITGRLKRFIKVNGHNVNLDDLEKKLADQNESIALIGCENSISICYTDNSIKPGYLIEFACSQTILNRRNFVEVGLAEIPRLSNGKVDYNRLESIVL